MQVALAFALKAALAILNFQSRVRKEMVEWPADHLLGLLGGRTEMAACHREKANFCPGD